MTMSIKEKSENEEIEWSPQMEIQLFFALDGLKPVGINKYFFMTCIADRLSKALDRDVSTEAIWSHLKTMYNLDALDELEPLPFPNEQKEFSLPDEFTTLITKKLQDAEEAARKADAAPPKGDTAKISGKPAAAVAAPPSGSSKTQQSQRSEASTVDKKVEAPPKRAPKRTRGSASLESSSSPSTTPPPIVSKRRRI